MGITTLIDFALVRPFVHAFLLVRHTHSLTEHQPGLGFWRNEIPLDPLGVLVVGFRFLVRRCFWHDLCHVSHILVVYSFPFRRMPATVYMLWFAC